MKEIDWEQDLLSGTSNPDLDFFPRDPYTGELLDD